MTGIKANLQKLMASPKTRQDVYDRVRQAFKGVHALCAATASDYLIRAGALNGYRPWTATLSRDLKAKGWQTVPLSALQKFDLVFTEDRNDNGAPDHVFTMLGWLDKKLGVVRIIDNYEVDSHPRNLHGPVTYEGKRLANTPAEYALRPPT